MSNFFGHRYLIAEIGSNWKTLSDLLSSISLAAKSGAQAVKFQYFKSSDLYGPFEEPLVDHLELKKEWLPQLKEKASACGVHLGLSVFHPRSVEEVRNYVDFFKLAQSESHWSLLLQEVMKSKKPIVASIGAHSEKTQDRIVEALKLYEGDVALLYSEPNYPAHFTNIGMVEAMRDRIGGNFTFGLSDHSLEVCFIPWYLRNLKHPIVLEKHVDMVGVESPDSVVSLDRDDFKLYADIFAGEPVRPMTKHQAFRHYYVRRWYAIEDIPLGAEIVPNRNIYCYRSKSGDSEALPADFPWDKVNKRAMQALSVGDAVTPKHITK